jgi:hypothetical protein
MLMLASSSSSPRHRGSIERGVDGGDHRVIGGLATEMYSDRLQEMIALSDRQRRRRALQQRELLVREREGTRCGGSAGAAGGGSDHAQGRGHRRGQSREMTRYRAVLRRFHMVVV